MVIIPTTRVCCDKELFFFMRKAFCGKKCNLFAPEEFT
jgi:hypothetical protein